MSNRGGRKKSNGRYNNGGGRGMAVDDFSSSNGSMGNTSRDAQAPFIEIRNWEGGTMSDVVSFIERKSQIALQSPKQNGNVVSAQVTPQQSRELQRWNGVKFCGQKLNIKIVYRGADTSATIQILHGFLQQRYDPNAKLLNFALMMSDPTLQSHGLLANPTTAIKMFQALMKVASDNLPQVESVSLEGNQLPDSEIAIHVANAYPKLLNLSLANNQISSVVGLIKLKNKFPMLRELVLAGNPLQQHPAYAQSQIREVVTLFPRLQVLDGATVRTEADLPRNALAAPVKPTFFEDEGVASIVPMFLANFFGLWDTNRAGLHPLYDQASLFSLCYNGSAPHLPTSKPAPSSYIQMSRNLLRNTSMATRHSKIYIGTQAVADAFSHVPASKHDLSNANAFAIDAWKVNDIRGPGDTAIMMVVHGEFIETPGSQVRSFDRSLVVLPGANGTYIVASDMLTIRSQSVLPQPTSQPQLQGQPQVGQPPVGQPVPGQPLGQPAPEQSLGQPALGQPPLGQPMQPLGQPVPPSAPQSIGQPAMGQPMGQPIPGPAGVKEELMRQTRLKDEFAEMCLKQANYDLNAALQLFQQSQSQLGPEAFQF